MDLLREFNAQAVTYWQSLPNIAQSLLAIIVVVLAFYIVRFVLLQQLEKLTAQTDNDLDDRLIHFLKQFLWLAALFFGLVWVLKINGIEVGPVLAGAGIAGIAIGH